MNRPAISKCSVYLASVCLIIICSGCNNEGGKAKVETAGKEIVTDSSSNPVNADTPISLTPVDTIPDKPVPGNDKTSGLKEPQVSKAGLTPSVTTKSRTDITSKEPGKTEVSKETIAQPTPVDPATEPKLAVETEKKPVETPGPVKDVVVSKPAEVAPTKIITATQNPWIVPAKDKNRVNPLASDAGSISEGKALFQKHCASCHGKTGAGDGTKAAQLNTPLSSFRLSSFQSQTDGALFYKIREGRDDMPAYRKKIPDEEEIWSVVNFLRTLK